MVDRGSSCAHRRPVQVVMCASRALSPANARCDPRRSWSLSEADRGPPAYRGAVISMDPGQPSVGAPPRAGRAAGAGGRGPALPVVLSILGLVLIWGSVFGSQSWAVLAAVFVAAGIAVVLLRSFWYTAGPGMLLLWARLIGGVRLQPDARILTVGATAEQVALMLTSRCPTGTATICGSVPVAGGERLPYADRRFALVALQLSGIGDRAREDLLREAARVLARGGDLLVLDYWHASRDEELLRGCGLRVRRVRPGRLGRRGGPLVPLAAVVAVSA